MTVLKLRNRGSVSRISYDGETALNSRHLCAEYAVGLGPDELSRLQRAFRDQYPHASVRVGPTSHFPGGYYVLQTYEPVFAKFMVDQDRQVKAKIDAGVGKGYGAAKRKHCWQFDVLVQGHKFTVDSGDPSSIRTLIEAVAADCAKANEKIARLNTVVPRIRSKLEEHLQLKSDFDRLKSDYDKLCSQSLQLSAENLRLRAQSELHKKPRIRVPALRRLAA